MSERVVRPLQAMYKQLIRAFQLQGNIGEFFTTYGGLLQGCALSMIALNSLISCWIETIRKEVPGAIPRAYADDICGTVSAKSKKRLREQVQKVHAVTRKYEAATGAEISPTKCFTYGNDCLQGQLPGIAAHSESFRFVRGSSTTTACNLPHTALEQKRIEQMERHGAEDS